MPGKTEQFKGWVEGQAKALRSKCSLEPFARLDPFELARKMEVKVYSPTQFSGLTSNLINDVVSIYAKKWDAGTLALPNNTHLIVLNEMREQVRQHSTLMEELVSCQLSSLQKEATFPKMRSAEAVH